KRRVAAYVTSTLNETPHCASGLEARLDDLHAPPALLEQLQSNPLDVHSGDARLDAVVTYAARLTLEPGGVEEVDVRRLRTVGLGDLEILDLNNIVAYYNYINRVANGLGLRTRISADHARGALPRSSR